MTTTNIQTAANKDWTLFLDRDGVINHETVGSYITHWDEFRFYEGVLGAVKQFSEIFGTVVMVTNQRGVGRGIMSLDALKDINIRMTAAIHENGGRLDKIYACTALEDSDHNRKPNTGMALQAKEDYPEIDFRKSVMIGNTLSDMEFGKKMGMHTIFIASTHEPFELPHDLIDEQYGSLADCANSFRSAEVV